MPKLDRNTKHDVDFSRVTAAKLHFAKFKFLYSGQTLKLNVHKQLRAETRPRFLLVSKLRRGMELLMFI